jgi:hypothetical protein
MKLEGALVEIVERRLSCVQKSCFEPQVANPSIGRCRLCSGHQVAGFAVLAKRGDGFLSERLHGRI